MLWRSELEMVTTLWVSSKTSILFILCDLFMEDLNYKTTSVRNAVFLSTLLILGVAKKEIWTVWRDSLIPLILGSMSHICLEHPFFKKYWNCIGLYILLFTQLTNYWREVGVILWKVQLLFFLLPFEISIIFLLIYWPATLGERESCRNTHFMNL